MASFGFRILCLHGYRQDSVAMKQKMGGLRKVLKRCEFLYVDAPNLVPDSSANEGSKQLSWFNNTSDGGFKYNANEKPEGYDDSLKVLNNFLQESGPFDIILGFSQGACMAALYIAELSIKGQIPFKAAILVSGFTTLVDDLKDLTLHKIIIPSFHVFSSKDTIIPHEATEAFMEQFENSVCFLHEGGHGFPSTSILKPPLTDFLQRLNADGDIINIK